MDVSPLSLPLLVEPLSGSRGWVCNESEKEGANQQGRRHDRKQQQQQHGGTGTLLLLPLLWLLAVLLVGVLLLLLLLLALSLTRCEQPLIQQLLLSPPSLSSSSSSSSSSSGPSCPVCHSFLLNAAVNNLKSWRLPPCCIPHVAHYVSSGAYHTDHATAIAAAAAYFGVPLGKGLGDDSVGWERRGGGGEGEMVGLVGVLGRKGGERKGTVAAGWGNEEGSWVWGEGQPASRGFSRQHLGKSVSESESGMTRGDEGDGEVQKRKQNRQEVVVFDIDETLLSNLPYLETHGYGSEPYNSSQWADWVRTSSAPPLPPGVALVRALQSSASRDHIHGYGPASYGEERHREEGSEGTSGLSAALVTGRPESQRAATVENLRRVGVTQWRVLMMRPLDANGNVVRETAVEYKSRCRREIEGMGMKIVGSVGDQWSDITGDATGDGTFKLPSPFYFIP
ncbi:hypothetical protein CLOP_g20232 [Closterium sp. NIES-67]|nr:hypothetical protein CLOP_g20232 [Closterium sp. NIES-67]